MKSHSARSAGPAGQQALAVEIAYGSHWSKDLPEPDIVARIKKWIEELKTNPDAVLDLNE